MIKGAYLNHLIIHVMTLGNEGWRDDQSNEHWYSIDPKKETWSASHFGDEPFNKGIQQT